MGKKEKKKEIASIFHGVEPKLVYKQKPIIGIDIGSSFVKLVQMKKNHVLGKTAFQTVPNGIMNQGRIEAIEPLVVIIKKSLKTNKIKTKKCALYLSGSEVIIRELRLPEMSETQIMDNIKQEIISMLPLDHDEYCIDYKILDYIRPEKEGAGQIRVLVAAVPGSMVKDYILTLKKAGLKLVYIDVLPNIAAKLCKRMSDEGKLDKISSTCIIDFGSRSTQIIIVKNNSYFIHKVINNGGEYLTSLISMKSDMDLITAETFKTKTNFFKENQDNPLNQHVVDHFEYLIRDFERTMEFYSNRNNHEKVQRIYIMGGGAMLEGLAQYMEKQLSIEVKLISDVFEKYQNKGDVGRTISIFSQAIGVTFREEW